MLSNTNNAAVQDTLRVIDEKDSRACSVSIALLSGSAPSSPDRPRRIGCWRNATLYELTRVTKAVHPAEQGVAA